MKGVVMNIKSNPTQVTLAADRFLKLGHSRGTRVECQAGALWITQDNDVTDYVLTAGQALELEHDGDALVFALMDSEVLLHEPVRAASPLDRFGRVLLDALDSLGRWIATYLGPQAVDTRKIRHWYGAQ